MLLSQWARIVLEVLPEPLTAYGHLDIESILVGTRVLEVHWPYWAFSFEYHPVIGWGTALLSYLAPHVAFLILAWGVIVAAAAGAVAWLLTRVVGTRRTMVFWSLSPQLLLFGGANFDAIAVLSVLAGAAFFARGRPARAGGALGVGTATKLFPAVAVPPLAIALWRRGARRSAVALVMAAVAALVILDGPAIVAPHSLLGSAVTPYQVSSWNLDSIWLPLAVGLGAFLDQPTVDRIVTAVSVLGLGVSYLALVVRPAMRGADPVWAAWLGVCAILIWTRLYSPQYAVWLLPVFALYVPRPGLLAFMFVGDALAFGTIFGLRGLGLRIEDPVALPLLGLMVVGVVVRHVALVLLLLRAYRPGSPAAPPPRLASQ
ncbi:MAG: hypothetical protein M3P16_12390 [Chloroflexota bacterium]|nr:hypothetical protein [Chloroflexota bacterium]